MATQDYYDRSDMIETLSYYVQNGISDEKLFEVLQIFYDVSELGVLNDMRHVRMSILKAMSGASNDALVEAGKVVMNEDLYQIKGKFYIYGDEEHG